MNSTLDAKKIGANLKCLRGNKTQREVANALGITTMAISQYENGDRIPRDEIKVKISKYYNKSIDELFFNLM